MTALKPLTCEVAREVLGWRVEYGWDVASTPEQTEHGPVWRVAVSGRATELVITGQGECLLAPPVAGQVAPAQKCV